MTDTTTEQELTALTPEHRTFVGIDSDGCVFDTMEVKQKQFFHGRIVRFWGLEEIEPVVRETAEFINLYSRWRGSNRFKALLRLFDMLRRRPEVVSAGTALPSCTSLRRFIDSGVPLGNASLEAAVAAWGDDELQRVLSWSEDVSAALERELPPIPPFSGVRECLTRLAADSDTMVVSQTPQADLVREWRAHELTPYVRVIAGQELGGKARQLRLSTAGRYAAGAVLMLGDSPNDLAAAREVGALFFPLLPGREEECWQRLQAESYDRFLAGDYAGAYEDELVTEFMRMLPEEPPWPTT